MKVAILSISCLAVVFAATVPDLEETGDWSAWSECSVPCGGGMMSRTIDCIDKKSGEVFSPCKKVQSNCNSFACPSDPSYVSWKNWGVCSEDCGGGKRSRAGTNAANEKYNQEIDCHTQSCTPLDPNEGCGYANLVFVLDSSQSVGELNWYVVKQFVIDVISKLEIGPDQTHVGVVIYASDVQAVIPLTEHMDADDLKEQIWNLPYMAGATNTGEAIRAMRKMMADGRRQDVKDIAFVLSDGKTNIVPGIVQSEATAAKDEDITVFSIGVTSEIDDDEMKGIASEPSDKYYSFVSDFGDLQQIIDDIVDGACEVTNIIICGPWSDWSDCPVSCGGPATQKSTRVCQVVDSEGNVLVDGIVRERIQDCGVQECPAPQPEPEPEPEPVIDCSKCDYGPYGSVQYLPDPLNCNCFFQCQRITNADGSYSYIPHRQCCAPTLFWRQSWLTCVTDTFKTVEKCIVVEATSPPSTSTTTQTFVCPLKVAPGKPGYFLNMEFEQYCGDNMIFNEKACACLPQPSDMTCDPDVLLYFPFDDDLNDHSCNRAVSTQTSEAMVKLTTDDVRGKCAVFDGASSLSVGFLYNYFADQYIKEWSMAVHVRRTGVTSLLSGIINNGDCIDEPSFDIHVGQGNVTQCGVDTDAVSTMAFTGKATLLPEVWEHVAMVYNGKTITLYRNGQSAASVQATGNIENRQCPMNIGAQHPGSEYFKGLMDEIYIYRRALSADEVQQLSKL